MEEPFRKVVEQIFNNWTALRLAVEHSMGGPDSKQTALECADYMVDYCVNTPNLQAEDVQEALEDILDQEFETICEDDSPKQIALIFVKFIELLKEGNTEQCELEFQKLPTTNVEWLKQQISTQNSMLQNDEDSSSDDEENDTQMDEDSEWTEVKSRRKR